MLTLKQINYFIRQYLRLARTTRDSGISDFAYQRATYFQSVRTGLLSRSVIVS